MVFSPHSVFIINFPPLFTALLAVVVLTPCGYFVAIYARDVLG